MDSLLKIIDASNWKRWTSDIFHGGQPSCWEKNLNNLKESIAFILSRSYPEKYPELKKAIFNYKNVTNDFIKVFEKYAEVTYYAEDNEENGHLDTRKFYKIDRWDPELYHSLLSKYEYHCFLVEDLALEMTRALNYIFEVVKELFDTKYRIDEGVLLIEIGPFMDLSYHIVRVEYSETEKETLYQGLRVFMDKRSEMNYYRGSGVSEDYFSKFF